MDMQREKSPRAMILASVASMIDQFNMTNIQLLKEQGYDVDVVCNCDEGNSISKERIEYIKDSLKKMNVTVYNLPIPRKVTNVKGVVQSIFNVKKICNQKKYALLHCHSPIGSVVARIAARKNRKSGLRVIYTAHGFHFYKGAPLINWLLFYPIEKICARWTDVLLTINKEDYSFAKKHMRIKRIEYIPGVGVDTNKFQMNSMDKRKKKTEVGIPEDAVVIFSVGELNENKNHEIIVKAIAKINNPRIHYVIAGQGEKRDCLKVLAHEMKVNIHLLGYRTDVSELYNMSDIFAFPSYREGLSVSLMEAMASGLPVVVSKIRGNVDLVEEGINGYMCNPSDSDKFAEKIQMLIQDKAKCINFGRNGIERIKDFDLKAVNRKMEKIYFK